MKDPRLDTNVCAYVATGAWHHFLVTGNRAGLASCGPCVQRALGFVLRCQRATGPCCGRSTPTGVLGRYPLLTGSSSIYHALRCGVACAEELGDERPEWELAAGRLAHVIARMPHVFEPKHQFAMDWYYPVLSGALSGEAAEARIDEWWDTFVMVGRGVRCVSTGPWVTAAETAECVLALDAVGRRSQAVDLITWAQAHRRDDGSYWTGSSIRRGDLPLRRAHHLYRRRHRPGRRRPWPMPPRRRPCSGARGCPPASTSTEPAPEAPVEPALRSPGTPGAS